MSSPLDSLIDIDLTDAIDRIPRMPGHQVLLPRSDERYGTFHYSAVVYRDRSEQAELKRVIDEAAFQIKKNWAKPGQSPIYGDGMMYDATALSSGKIVRTRKRRQQLWHCNNVIGNRASWSIHVMLGPDQDLTAPQRVSVYRIFDALLESGVPRSNIVAHCEWPLRNGFPVITSTYHPQEDQSACPGPTLFPYIPAYRLGRGNPSVPAWESYRVRSGVDYAQVRTDRNNKSPEAMIAGVSARYQPGAVLAIDDVTNGWGHLSGGLGFVAMSLLEAV